MLFNLGIFTFESKKKYKFVKICISSKVFVFPGGGVKNYLFIFRDWTGEEWSNQKAPNTTARLAHVEIEHEQMSFPLHHKTPANSS